MAEEGREIEVKFHVRDLAAVARRIQSLGGALRTPRTHEQNLRFDTPDGAMRREGRALRLRRDAQVRITYKGPSTWSNGARLRDELETSVGDFDTAQRLLQEVGFIVVFEYEKYRTTYNLGEVEVMLDELPFGDFVEVEGGAEHLRAIAGQLSLNWDAALPDSYHALFEKLQARHHLRFRDLTFGNFSGIPARIDDIGVAAADL